MAENGGQVKRPTFGGDQGRSQVFIGGGASWGHINLSKKFSAKHR